MPIFGHDDDDDRFGFSNRHEKLKVPCEVRGEVIGIVFRGVTYNFTIPQRFFPDEKVRSLIRALATTRNYHLENPGLFFEFLKNLFKSVDIKMK